jgi:hypothetical protein
MAAPNTLSELSAALKQHNEDANQSQEFLGERVFFGLVAKNESFGGAQDSSASVALSNRAMPVVIDIGRTGGRSATFSSAQTIAGSRAKTIKAFQVTGVDNYSVVRVPGKTLAFANGQNDAWELLISSLAKKGLDDAQDNLADDIETSMYRDATGVLATISSASGASPNVLTLSEADAAMLFELGDYVEGVRTNRYTSTATAAQHAYAYVSGIDIPNNTITITAALDADALADATAFDATTDKWIRGYGDCASAATWAGSTKLLGAQCWCPTSMSTEAANLFLGVNRYSSSRLYGKYMDHSAKSRVQGLVHGAAQLAKEGGAPTKGLIGYTDYRALLEELDVQKEFRDVNAVGSRALTANISFKGVVVHGINSDIVIMPSPRQVNQEVLLIRSEDWVLYSAGPALNLEDYDGLSILRMATEDAYEGRMCFRGQLVCRRPGRQGRVLLPAV